MSSTPQLSGRLTALLALAVGVLAANLYYAQPLTTLMASSLGMQPAHAGLVVTMTQIGYGLGVFLLVPLGDLLENRKVILALMGVAIAALMAIGLVQDASSYFIAALALGAGVSALQIIVPYATHLSPEEVRGRVVGSLMSGLMLGIMLSRPIAGFLSDWVSWHAVYFLSAGFMTVIAVILFCFLPSRQPVRGTVGYFGLIASMWELLVRYSVLRRRAFYQACMFAAFCLFWTASPMLLAGPEFHLSQSQIALFALVGITGAVFAPVVGKLADRGFTQRASFFSFAGGSISFLLSRVGEPGSALSLGCLTLAAVLLDAGVSGNLVLGQRAIFSLEPEFRGRLNSLYIAIIFIGGSLGSFLGAWAYARGQWPLTAWIGLALPTTGFLLFLTEWRRRPTLR
jgi:predicted MFS family arabinose efflux permease